MVVPLMIGIGALFTLLLIRFVSGGSPQQKESERRRKEFDNIISDFPYELNGSKDKYRSVHRMIYDEFNKNDQLHRLLNFGFSDFDSPEVGFVSNRDWLLKYCPTSLGFEIGVYFDDAEFMAKFAIDQCHKALVIADLCEYCDKLHVRRALEKLGPVHGKVLIPKNALYKRGDIELLRFVQGVLPDCDVLNPNEKTKYRHADYNFGCSWEFSTLLNDAVESDDVEQVRFLLSLGANTNECLHAFWNRQQDSPTVMSHPIILNIKSQHVFNLMANAGMNIYPRECNFKDGKNDMGKPIDLNENLLKWRADWVALHKDSKASVKGFC